MSVHPVVAIENVTVVKDGTTVLDDVTWEIGTGERWVLFGANGSGKTTLLEVASSYLFPTRGTVRLFGERLGRTDVRTLRPRIGNVGPGPAQYVRSRLPAIDIVVTGLHASFVDTRWHDYDESDWRRARECLRLLDAGRLADRTFGTLSEGEKKRILVARSLMASPELLLLDEPGSGLDLGSREQLIASLASLAADPGSPPVVLVTHHPEEIPPGFDRVLMIGGGRVVAQGKVEEVLTAAALTATFGMSLDIERRGERWRAWARQEGTNE
jgi:iron complex transport system ATP-binding protein